MNRSRSVTKVSEAASLAAEPYRIQPDHAFRRRVRLAGDEILACSINLPIPL